MSNTNFIEQLDSIFKSHYGQTFDWIKASLNKEKGIVDIISKESELEGLIREIENG